LRGRRARFLSLALVVSFSALAVAQSGKVESIGALTDTAVPNAVRQSLEDKGYRLTLDDPKPSCEVWFRKSVPVAAKKGPEAAAYPQLSESVMVGVIRFPDNSTDFRAHRVPAGFYTLRYEMMPDDGNHLGAAPNPDFLLLIPASSDTDPNSTFKFQELVPMSAKTSGTKHPSPLSLAPPDKAGPPAVKKDDQDHWIFSSSVKLSSGEEIPLFLIVKGTAQQ
jgi:hypothetical protein